VAWSLLQKTAAPATSASGSLPVTLPGGSTSGTLLVCCLASNSNAAWSGPAGWVQGPDTSNGTVNQATIFYYLNNPGSISSATFTNAGSALKGEMAEFSFGQGLTEVNASGAGTAGAVATCSATTTTQAAAGDLGVCCFSEHSNANLSPTWVDPSGWAQLGASTAAAANQIYSAYSTPLVTGTLSVTANSQAASAVATGWTGTVVTFTVVVPTAALAGQGSLLAVPSIAPAALLAGLGAMLAVGITNRVPGGGRTVITGPAQSTTVTGPAQSATVS